MFKGLTHFVAVTLSLFTMATYPVQAANIPLSSGSLASALSPIEKASVDPAGDIGSTALAIARSQFADVFGGMELTNNGSHVNMYLTKLDASVEKAIVGFAPASDFTFILTPHTEAQVQAVHQKVIDAATAIQANGTKLVAWGPDVKTGKEFLRVQNVTPAQEASLIEQFGAANVEIQNTADVIVATANRSLDSSPWNGGDFISDGSEDCTSGFPAHNSTSSFMITAGHCFALGSNVDNGAATLGLGNFSIMGSVSNRDTSGGGMDVELFNTTSDGGSSKLVWSGSSTSPVADAVSGHGQLSAGSQVCQSGAFDGEICSLTISTANECITEQTSSTTTRNICHVWQASNPNGGIANGAGDSGGPVFYFSGSLLESTGIVSAGSGSATCSNYSSNRSCYSTLYYTDINQILSQYGITLNT